MKWKELKWSKTNLNKLKQQKEYKNKINNILDRINFFFSFKICLNIWFRILESCSL